MAMRAETISNSSLTESLTNGIAERIFRNGKEHTDGVVQKNNRFYCKDTIVESLASNISAIRHSGYNKKVSVQHILSLFYKAVKCGPNAIANTKNGNYSVIGSIIENERLFMVDLIINPKRPHTSVVNKKGIGYSKHALSRILYRYKPKKLDRVLSNLACLVMDLISTTNMEEEIEKNETAWLYVPKHGGFLIGKDKSEYVLITFINETLMTPIQSMQGEKTLLQVKENNIELFDIINSELIWPELYNPSEYCEFSVVQMVKNKSQYK